MNVYLGVVSNVFSNVFVKIIKYLSNMTSFLLKLNSIYALIIFILFFIVFI